MKQKLLLLDLLLAALVVYAGLTLKNRWDASHQREMAFLALRVPQIPAPAMAPLPGVNPAKAATYLDVAQKMLFARDRNPNVIYDPPPPPPPPPPVPAVPRAHGVMQLGATPTVILSEVAGGPHKSYRPGDEIGPFKLLAVNNTHILFEWKGLRILKTIEEITDRSGPPSAGGEAAKNASSAATTVEPTKDPEPAKEGPSNIDMGNDSKACVAGDTSPAGAVVNGMRKVVQSTPFGNSCRWVPAK